ncbi:MAG: hypothetical protein L6U99_13620 [Clostridium sp.]|nr:MAG: hypothetical protein L6U99_13620 [Clostridium sp.]
MTASGNPVTKEQLNETKVIYKYMPNFNAEIMSFNKERYQYTSVYIGKKKDLLKKSN